MKNYIVYVNAGYLAADNGATDAIKKMYDVASLANSCICSEGYWGSDNFEVKADDLELIIELLLDSKIPYRIHHHPEGDGWKGLFAEAVRQQCRVGADYNPKYEQLHF